ncbi:MAG: hypothetical protein ACLSBN_06610 [Clostridium perfringens]
MDKKDEIYKKVKKVLIKISIAIGIIILIFLFLIVPIIIFFLLKNGVEKGAEDSWAIGVGFYGALLGGLGTIIAFLVTSFLNIKIQKENNFLLKEQFSQDKRLTIKPYLDLSWYDTDRNDIISINKNNPIKLIKNFPNFKCYQDLLEINNLGLGPAIDVKITKMTLNNRDIILDEDITWFNSININSKKFFGIDLAILEINEEKQKLYGNIDEIEKKYNQSKELYFRIEYGDILDNKYIKDVYLIITTNSIIEYNNDEDLYEMIDFSYSIETNENKCYEKLKKRSI